MGKLPAVECSLSSQSPFLNSREVQIVKALTTCRVAVFVLAGGLVVNAMAESAFAQTLEQQSVPKERAAHKEPAAPEPQVSPEQKAAAEKLGLPVAITNSLSMKLVLIPAGEFMMGSPKREDGRASDEQQHRVRITQPFYLGAREVTQAQYQKVMGTNPSHFKDAQNPVENVCWGDAMRFCYKLSELPEEQAASRVYRLPTEAEWEYACRAGSTTTWAFGNEETGLGEYAWYGSNSQGHTHPVGEKKANMLGLYDMYGNVWEWCGDWYDPSYYLNSPPADPTGPMAGSIRVYRGGSWSYPAAGCRSAYRFWDRPGDRNLSLGFRVATVPSASPASPASGAASGSR